MIKKLDSDENLTSYLIENYGENLKLKDENARKTIVSGTKSMVKFLASSKMNFKRIEEINKHECNDLCPYYRENWENIIKCDQKKGTHDQMD